MTLRDLMNAARTHGMAVRKVDGEYQVKTKGALWADAATYYTDDIQDAHATMLAMSAHIGSREVDSILVECAPAKTANATIEVPTLDHDKMMLERFGHKVSPNGRLERRIVANLIAHLSERGWMVCSVDDGDERTDVTNAKQAMELIFNLDDVNVFFTNGNRTHRVYLVLGNGLDIISDHTYAAIQDDDFDASIDAFDTMEFA
jgi:hypothetical protein